MPTTFTTNYRPSVHGFRFGNAFRHEIAGPIATWGRCNGMSAVSLDYFNAGRPAPAITAVDHGVRPVSGVGASTWRADHVELFVRRHADQVAGRTLNGAGPVPWRTLFGSAVTGTPAAASWAPGRVDLFVRGGDGNYWHQWRDGGPWVGESPCAAVPHYPEHLGGPFESSPAVAAPFANRLELYGRDSRGELQFRYWDGTWHPWVSLGRPSSVTLTGDPAAASQTGWMVAIVQGSDRAYWMKEWANGGWQAWRSIGGAFTSSPAVASPYPGRLEVYGRGLDGAIWLNVLERGAWNGWHSLGAPAPGLTAERPAAVGHWGHLSVFAIGNDTQLWRKRWINGGWQAWEAIEPPITTDSRRLTDAIYERLMASTIRPIIGAIGSLGIALPFMGAVRNYITLRAHHNDQLFQWANVDELTKLTRFFSNRQPIPLGLLDTGGGTGHEVVAFGAVLGAEHPLGEHSASGRNNFIHVYDPNYPGCDNITIKLDPANRTIVSSTGEQWRALFVRDDYRPERPPV